MKQVFYHIIISAVAIFLFFATSRVVAQVSVNTTGAEASSSAMLDVSSTSKGLLVPRMTKQQREAIQNPAIGLLVYQTNYPEGFYYRALFGWENLSTVNGTWSLKGNAGTNPYQDFIGTTDAQDLGFRVNNAYKLKITPQGQLETYGTGLSVFLGRMAGSHDDLTNNQNVFVGCYAGNNNTSGENNTMVGFGSAKYNSTGKNNAIFGYKALFQNVSSSNNCAFGFHSLYYHSTGEKNVAVGHLSLYSDTSGISNTAVGASSMEYNKSGMNNTAVGFQSLLFNNSGSFNVAMGYNAMAQNNSGNNNIAIGTSALDRNTTHSNLIAIGDSALFYNGNSGTGEYESIGNIAVGQKALFSNTTGVYNTAVGNYALKDNTTGSLNISMGYQSLQNNTTGYSNTAIANNSLTSNTSGHENTAMGIYSLVGNTTGNGNTSIGAGALLGNTTGNSNVAMGIAALYNNMINSNLVAIGDSALYNNGVGATSNADGAGNVAVGSKTLFTNTLGNSNTAVGYHAMYYNSTGSNNTTLGYEAGQNITQGSNNIVIGYKVSAPSRTGNNRMSIGNLIFGTGVDGIGTYLSSGNVGIGVSDPSAKLEVNGQVKITGGNPGSGKILVSNADGLASWDSTAHTLLYDADSNTLVQVEKNSNEDKIRFKTGGIEHFVFDNGRISVKNTGSSVFLGEEAGFYDNLASNNNTFVGHQSGKSNVSGSDNVALGHQSLLYCNGSRNVAVGKDAGRINTSGWYNILIGYDVHTTAHNASSELNIGNVLYGTGIHLTNPKIGIGTAYPDEKLDVRGNLQVKQTSGDVYANIESSTAGAYLSLKAAGSTLAQVKFFDNGSYGASMGYDNAQDRIFFYHNANVFVKNGDVLPGVNKGGDLGANGQAWDNIYYDDLFNQGAAAFTSRNVTNEIVSHPPKQKLPGSFDYKTKRGDIELDPKSLPDGLHQNNAILTDEMSSYNYKANYEQQLIINRQQKTIKQQQQTINDLSKRLERLEKMMGK